MDLDDVASWPSGRLLSTAARLVEHAWNAHLAQWGLSHAGLAVLQVLGEGPRTQRELAAVVGVEEQTISRTVERLERAGHVERRRDEADRRRILVSRTRDGQRMFLRAADLSLAEGLVTDGVADPEALRAALTAIVVRLSEQRWGEPAPETAPDPARTLGA